MFNKIIIPNENITVDNFHSVVTHKAKKFNYVCELNPCTISHISGKITNLQGNSFFNRFGHNVIYSMVLKTGPDFHIPKFCNFYIETNIRDIDTNPRLQENSDVILCTTIARTAHEAIYILYNKPMNKYYLQK